ncbi:alpha/beta hydrolase [Sporomusa acidovorans]|uniref:AB hydrolase-1 domain-containing protein n=1 Tax=Sporomusa acidovorans (strain ATCC 49682 / DSM 3132 / Mol) TaxID=1123286 RepID=A0ABZ3JBK7_SPOA4|nr:alpha/beta hydrolase [Sporomusa acidovorans]OZC13260.1 alpha/beta hydrolase family protein [Sporomusa acidovorans DSM 3132]SDD98953.1 hypothetical protein SAMN04488499_100696 [Sporomusa acidovorans]
MYRDSELRALKRRAWRQNGVVMLAVLVVLFVIINAVGLVAGNAFYQEFCIRHTRFGIERLQPLQKVLNEGIHSGRWQAVSLESRLGYRLEGTYLPNPKPTNNTVIFVHGIAGTRLVGLWYVPMYWKAGYNVLVYDSRASGDSGGSSVTWGFYERYDLDQWVDWVEQHNPGGIIGVHGMSMGAATALLHAEMNEATHRVRFYIADSAYADLETLLIQQIDATVRLHNPAWVKLLLWYASLAANWQAGFRFQDVSPVHAVQTVTTPVLYLHGGADALVPPAMCEQLYAATKGDKEKRIFPNVPHAMSYFNHQDEYRQRVLNFVANHSER